MVKDIKLRQVLAPSQVFQTVKILIVKFKLAFWSLLDALKI